MRRTDHPEVADALAELGFNQLQQKKYTEAEPLLRECLKIREQQLPDDWRRFYTQSLLGCSLVGLKKYAAAEPLLLAGYEGMKAREQAIPAASRVRLTEALEWIIQLYEARGKPDQAAEWRAKLVPPPRAEIKPKP
jgi:hypothetical protein